MSVGSDQSASCASLHGAMPRPYNKMQMGGNIFNKTARIITEWRTIYLQDLSHCCTTLWGRTMRTELKRTREPTPVQTSRFLQTEKNFHTYKTSPQATFFHDRRWKARLSARFIKNLHSHNFRLFCEGFLSSRFINSSLYPELAQIKATKR